MLTKQKLLKQNFLNNYFEKEDYLKNYLLEYYNDYKRKKLKSIFLLKRRLYYDLKFKPITFNFIKIISNNVAFGFGDKFDVYIKLKKSKIFASFKHYRPNLLNIFKFSSLKYTNYGWRFKKKKLKDILNIYKNDFNLYFFLKGFFFMLKKSKKNFSFFKTFFFFDFFYKKIIKKFFVF